MLYRVTLYFYDGPLIGTTCQHSYFEVANDAKAIALFHDEVESSLTHSAILERIERRERSVIVTEIEC